MAEHRVSGFLAVVTGVALLAVGVSGAGAAKRDRAVVDLDRRCEVRGPSTAGADAQLTDWRSAPYLRPRGRLRAALVFADFSDATGPVGATRSIRRATVPLLRRWSAEASYGRARLKVDASDFWVRMPRPSTAYWPPGGAFRPDEYIRDAVRTADPRVDFGDADLVYIVAAPGSQIVLSPAYVEPRLRADDTPLRRFVTLGQNLYNPERHPAAMLIQGTAHIFSLPYLHDPGQAGGAGNRWAGAWDPMGEPGLLSHTNAWSKRKIGWLEPGKEMLCIRTGKVTKRLTALSRDRGLRAISVRLNRRERYVIEARRRHGFDSALCSEGVLVWLIDGRKASGEGPMRVQPARDDSDNPARACRGAGISGALDRAPFTPGQVFRDRREGVTVKVLGATKQGFRVRVTRR